jgi:hypothetical protein
MRFWLVIDLLGPANHGATTEISDQRVMGEEAFVRCGDETKRSNSASFCILEGRTGVDILSTCI